jgi:hypothetical protein
MILFIFSCGSSKNNKNDKKAAVDSTLSRDTLQTQDTMKIPIPHPEPGLPPGTARITGRFLDIEMQSSQAVMKVEVTTVNEYGSSTPAIATGVPLTVVIPPYMIKNVKTLKSDKKIVCVLNYRQFISSDEEKSGDNSRWVLKRISTAIDSP